MEDQRYWQVCPQSHRVSKNEVLHDNLQAFTTNWDHTFVVMQKEPQDQTLDTLYFRQLEKSEKLMSLVSLYSKDIVQNEERQKKKVEQDGDVVSRTESA